MKQQLTDHSRQYCQSALRGTILSLTMLAFLTGCASTYPRLTEPNEAFRDALTLTSSEEPADGDAAIRRVIALFEDFSEENLRENTRRVYADTLFFRDGFKYLTNIDELEQYMVESTAPLRSCTFAFEPPVVDGADYYLRWVMKVNLKRDAEDRVDEVVGMSHIRFNREGKVVFQQDYWDPTDVLYRRIPVANRLIGAVRARL